MEFELPLPPSVNRLWRNIGNRTILSREARVYRQTVKSILQCERIETLVGPIAVDILVFPPDRRRRDIDNFPKALLDSLQHAGVFVDDSQIERMSIERREVIPNGRVIVKVEPIEVPVPAIVKRVRKRIAKRHINIPTEALD
jgi:crossover junction endodeoxyribonuclease RusA